ncbi:hypothetical protein FQN54_002822 [Arachnomyces sp. PD_36]|nr:hypothetical protein FQN54_002822 [Arachnomyces sp. PD_36]
MTLESPLLYRPTDSLILPSQRRFFPFKIPNSHIQLRHYISTADPDFIYVAVDRVIYSIRISTRKRDIVTIVPFEPKCLTAGLGWIAVGGKVRGDCAFIRLAGGHGSIHSDTVMGTSSVDVDTPLPLDLDPSSRRLPPWAPGEYGPESHIRRSNRRRVPEVQIKEFGGTIVNSVTLHRLVGDNDLYADEDIAVLRFVNLALGIVLASFTDVIWGYSNNDMTVSIYSLTRSKMIEVMHYPICMNYAIISPDSKVLAAVGDEDRIYFYHIKPCPKEQVSAPQEGKMLMGWEWPLIRTVDLESDSRYDDRCCFTIAFSPSSQLCATASQSGIISVFDMATIYDTNSDLKPDHELILCSFRSSRSSSSGGAVRCMTFSPEPWDLLVWTEDNGRAGIADVRQAFSRRQILVLDPEESGLQKVRTEGTRRGNHHAVPDPEHGDRSLARPEEIARSDDDADAINHLISMMEDPSIERRGDSESQRMRDNLILDITERERQIIEFLGTNRWAGSGEEGQSSSMPGVGPGPVMPHSSARAEPLTSNNEGGDDSSRPSSPPTRYIDALHEFIRERHLERMRSGNRSFQPRRRGSVVLSQDNINNSNSASQSSNVSSPGSRNGLAMRLSASPTPIQPSGPQTADHRSPSPPAIESTAATGANATTRPQDRLNRHRVIAEGPSAILSATTSARQRAQRSRSIPRRQDRPEGSSTEPLETQRLLTPEIRSSLAAERLRLQRQAADEESHRLRQWEQQYRQQLVGFDQNRSPGWTRSILHDMSDRNGEMDPERGPGTAGIGWGADGRTLYIGTVEGIFEYQLNVQDRKTFPGFSCR